MRGWIGGLMLVATSCTTVPSGNGDTPRPAASGNGCDAAPAQQLIGQQATEALGAKAQSLAGAGTMRWQRPGEMVTMEFRPDRLNLRLDERNRVVSISCG